MRNYITIDGKIGYLNLRTGKYKWVPIIGITEDSFIMREERMQGKNYRFVNEYKERKEDVINFLKTPSLDFKDGRPILKYKGTTKNYINSQPTK